MKASSNPMHSLLSSYCGGRTERGGERKRHSYSIQTMSNSELYFYQEHLSKRNLVLRAALISFLMASLAKHNIVQSTETGALPGLCGPLGKAVYTYVDDRYQDDIAETKPTGRVAEKTPLNLSGLFGSSELMRSYCIAGTERP